jgi:signal transduction histidine kinase
LPYKKNNISFTFQAISLGGGQNTQYRYRLLGLDASAWSEWGPGNSVTYSALPPGKFAFQVECRAGEGKANPRFEYPFEIITPLRKTTLFRFAVLIACILTGIVLQYIVGSRKQRRQRLLDKLRAEEQSKIRLRTAEDFHDEIGNKLTRINVLTNVLKNKISLTPESERILNQIEDNTGQLYTGTRDILWSLKPSNDNLYEILHHIRDFGADLFMDTEVNFEFKGASEKWRNFRLPMDMSRNLVMIFKEALNNCLKYSQAHNVSLEVILKNRNVLQMILKDDGKGFDKDSPRTGNGINNMHVRATRLGGRLYVDSRKNKGTIINLTFKLPRPTGK